MVLVSSSPPAVRGEKCEVGPCAALVIIYLLDINNCILTLTIIIFFDSYYTKTLTEQLTFYGVTHVIPM